MPWSNQNGGGGPWGGGGGGNNQGPWGQGPNRPRGGGGGNGNGGPPDLEDIIRRGQDKLKTVMPGGFNGGVVVIALLLLGVFWLMNAIYTVQPDERGVELRFGKPKDEISMPGLHFHLWPLETVEITKVTEQQQNIGALERSAKFAFPFGLHHQPGEVAAPPALNIPRPGVVAVGNPGFQPLDHNRAHYHRAMFAAHRGAGAGHCVLPPDCIGGMGRTFGRAGGRVLIDRDRGRGGGGVP